MTDTLTPGSEWRRIRTTKTVPMPLKGWAKWKAFLTRKPLTKDVEMTASAWVNGPAIIDIITTGSGHSVAVHSPDGSQPRVEWPQLEWRTND